MLTRQPRFATADVGSTGHRNKSFPIYPIGEAPDPARTPGNRALLWLLWATLGWAGVHLYFLDQLHHALRRAGLFVLFVTLITTAFGLQGWEEHQVPRLLGNACMVAGISAALILFWKWSGDAVRLHALLSRPSRKVQTLRCGATGRDCMLGLDRRAVCPLLVRPNETKGRAARREEEN
jgi:hypothetical protein